MKLRELTDEFINPSAVYRAKPFWAWNGELDRDELMRQVRIIKEMGFGGFFMHSRTGLATEYLGHKWMDLTNECADAAEKEGLEAWLYDEDRWPSGIAGGLVTQEEACRAKFLEMSIFDSKEKSEIPKDTVAVFSFRREKNGEKSIQKIELDKVDKSDGILCFSVVLSECKEVYNGSAYVDTMNVNAVRKFVELTHEKYRKQCECRLGRSIRGIFTDEPHRGAMFSSFSEGRKNRIPYTDQLFQRFEKMCGYDLREKLPELFLREESVFSQTAYDYVKLCQQLFLEGYAQTIGKWCSNNHMIFTGHVLHEDSLSAQTVMQGSVMQFYEYMDYPGIDILTEYNICWWVVKQAVSVAKQLNKPFVLSEMYGGTGWNMSMEKYKQIGDWQALFGINLRCPHLSWYTMKGEAKRDYPASIFYQSAWYKEYKELETYFARIAVFLSQGREACNLLVINPVESVWGYSRMGAFDGLEAADPRIRFLEKRYADTFEILAEGHIAFDYGEEAMLERRGKVDADGLWIGHCCYKKVLITGMDTIRSSTLCLLREFARLGGRVIFAGDLPANVDGIKSESVLATADECTRINYDKESILELCASQRDIRITGEGAENIFCRVNDAEQERYIMLLNIDRDKRHTGISVTLGPCDCLEKWDARTGEVSNIELDNGNGTIEMDFEPGEEKLYRLCRKITANTTEYANQIEMFPYRLSEPNILVMDYVTVEGGGVSVKGEVLKADRTLRSILGLPLRSGEMLQPWYMKMHEKEQYEKKWPVYLKYKFAVWEIPMELMLAFEDKENVRGIFVNGREHMEDTVDKKVWVDPCFDIVQINSEFIRVGENEIIIKYEYQQRNGIEATYLLGNFGVYWNEVSHGWEIAGLPEKLKCGDVTYQGLPFYSGEICYQLPEMNGKYRICNIDFAGSCLRVTGNDEKILFAPPYSCEMEHPKELKVILTRRNTFGPLHCTERKRFAYGPESFLTEGKEWTDEYVLEKQGLLSPPEFIKMEE